MRFSMKTLLVVVSVAAALLSALATMPEEPSVLFFLGLLSAMPAITLMLAVCGRGATRAFGVVGTFFQISFWLVFWTTDRDQWFYREIRKSLYWFMGLATNEAGLGPEMKTWFVLVGTMTLLGGAAGAAIYWCCVSSERSEA